MKNFLESEIKKFLNYISKTKSKQTYKTYNTVLKEALKHIEIEDNFFDITPYRLKIAHQNKKTIAKKISTLRSFFEFLQSEGFKFKIRGDEHIKVPKTLPKPISTEHIKQALKIADLKEFTAIITVFSLGLRISEACDMKLEDINKEWVKITGKGSKTRMIPIHPKLYEIIQKYIQIYKPNTYLFEKNKNKINDQQLRYLIQKPFRKTGLHITPHQLRHSFATYLLDNGARITDVSELLGHEFISTTQIYTKLSNSLKLKNYLKAHPLCS